MEVSVLEMSPVGACILEEHLVVDPILPEAEHEGAFVAVLVCCIGICTRDTIGHDAKFGVWDGGAVAVL